MQNAIHMMELLPAPRGPRVMSSVPLYLLGIPYNGPSPKASVCHSGTGEPSVGDSSFEDPRGNTDDRELEVEPPSRPSRGQGRGLPLANDSGFLLRDHNVDPGPRGASRVVWAPDAYRVSSKPLVMTRTCVGWFATTCERSAERAYCGPGMPGV